MVGNNGSDLLDEVLDSIVLANQIFVAEGGLDRLNLHFLLAIPHAGLCWISLFLRVDSDWDGLAPLVLHAVKHFIY